MKKISLIAAIFSLILLTGCTSTPRVEKGDTVTIIATGLLEDKTIADSFYLTITAGSGEIIRGIDEAILGMKVGKTKKISIEPVDGYLPDYKESNVQKVGKLIFDKLGITAETGTTVQLGDLTGYIKGISSDKSGNTIILFDVNPLKTRKPLNYTFTIIDIKKADSYKL